MKNIIINPHISSRRCAAIMLLAALCCAPLAHGAETGAASALAPDAAAPAPSAQTLSISTQDPPAQNPPAREAAPLPSGNNAASPPVMWPKPDVPRQSVMADFSMYRAAGREVDSSLHLFILPWNSSSDGAQGGLAYDHIASYMPAPNGAFWLDRYSLVVLGGHTEKLKYGYLGLAWTDTHGALRTYEFSIYAGGRYPIGGPFFVDGRLTLPLAGMFIGAAATSGSIFEYEAALGVGNENAAFKVGIHYLNVPADPRNGQPYDFTRRWVFAGFSLAY